MTIWFFCDSSWKRGEKLHSLWPELRVTFPQCLQQGWLLPDPVNKLCLVHVSSLCSQNGKRSCTPRPQCCKRSHLFQHQHKHPQVWWHIHHSNTPSLPLLFPARWYRRKTWSQLKTKDQALLEQRFLLCALNIFTNVSCVCSVEVVWDTTEPISMQTQSW